MKAEALVCLAKWVAPVARLLFGALVMTQCACAALGNSGKSDQGLFCPEPDGQRVFVSNHGWHTGLVLESAIVFKYLPGLVSRFAGERYLEIGWGDAGFYQSERITGSTVLKAIAWPSRSVLHVAAFNSSPELYFEQSEVVPLDLSASQVDQVMEFVAASFARNPDRALLKTRTGIYGNSQFYDAVGTYYLFNTCNSWTANALKRAGLDISPALSLTASSVMAKVRKHSQCAKP